MASGINIYDLPPEILTKLLSFLPDIDLATVPLVCKRFQAAVQIDSVWQKRCQDEFGIADNSSGKDSEVQLSYRDIYINLLHKYGRLLGLWSPSIGPYGGLIHVQYKEACITGYRVFPSPRDVYKPLRCKALFTMGLDKDKLTAVQCLQQSNCQPHSCTVRLDKDGFQFLCSDFDELHGDQVVELDDEYALQLNLPEFLFHLNSRLFMPGELVEKLDCERVHIPKPEPGLPIQPGLFKGAYGAHGTELIMLSYDDERKEALGTKISGDPNVPAGEISLKVDLTRPMVLTMMQQDSLVTLADIDIPDLPPDVDVSSLPRQPFQVPSDCFERSTNAPDSCIARYHSKGQISQHGFVDPSFIPGHWIVFDQNTFGHIWLELQSFSIYSRCTEEFRTAVKT